MNKLIYPDANEALYESVEGKMATLIDSNKMIKQASSNSITKKMLEECKPDKDHFLIHAIGVGDYEKYGFNKNADAFPKLADENYYNTFEKYAHVFKEHNSSNPEKNAIGIVKKACYNKDMGRIELALWVNIKKASEDYEKAKAGEPLSFSMGCSVTADRDSISGKLSRTMNEYEPWMKKTPGQYIPEYKKYAFVYNDEPKFFDISIVKRPAERIAHYLEYKFNNEPIKDELLKSAAVNNTCIPSALLAEIEGLRYTLNPEFSNIKKANIVNRLAEKEKEFIDILSDKSINTPQAAFIKNAALIIFNPEDEEDFDLSNITIRPKTLFRELACRKTILPFKSFMKCFFPEECIQDKDAIDFASIHLLPNLFSNLNSFGIDMDSLDGLFDAGNSIDSILDNADSDPVQKLMNSVEDKFSLDTDKRGKRIIKIIISKDSNIPFEDIINNILPNILSIKTATPKLENKNVYNTAIKYASIYAAYKVAAIKDIEELKENKNKLDDASMYSLIAQDYIYNLK